MLDKPIMLDETGKEIAAHLAQLCINTGGLRKIKDWADIRALVRQGRIGDYLEVGDQLAVARERGITVSAPSEMTATVDEDAFVAATGEAGEKVYEFESDGSAWHLDGVAVDLAAYGITTTGTPKDGDRLVLHETADTIYYDVGGIDYDVPSNPALTHSLTLVQSDLATYGTIPFDAAEALYYVNPEKWPSGLPAGTYNITLDHGSYVNSTAEDGTYQFTTTKTIPAGGFIRHSTMGAYLSTGAYNQARVLGGTFTAYDTDYNSVESGLATTLGSDGTSLGATTAETPSYRTSDDLNFTRRQTYGSNVWATSAARQWMNSSAKGAASGQIASWWKSQHKFDFPVKSTLPGYLHGIDPSFISMLGKVRKRTAYSEADGYGYVDTDELVCLLSMTEVNFGTNNSVYECPVAWDGTAKTVPLDMFVGAVDADRIRYYGGIARYNFLRSPYPTNCRSVRFVTPTGGLNNINACSAYGQWPSLAII